MPVPDYIRKLRAHFGNELLFVPTVAIVARDAAGRLLLVRDRESAFWGFPGGIVEPLEVPADAAVREAWEEAGVYVELTRLVGVFGGPEYTTTYANGHRLAWIATVFAARVAGGEPRPDAAETSDARLCAENELSALAMRDHALCFLAAERDGAAGGYFAPPTWRPETR
jgi:ADP-ribose pyrophosphatase YjhB (NUDIX family)